MVSTFIIDWPVLIFLGLLFSYGVKGRPGKSLFLTRAYVSGKIVVTFFVGMVVYSYLQYPDWMFMYFVKGSDVPVWMVVSILILYYLAFTVGFLMRFEMEKIAKGLSIFSLISLLAASVAVVLPLKDRYLHVGSFQEFYAGTAVPLNQLPMGRTLTLLTIGLLFIGLGLLYWSRKETFSPLLM